MSATDAMLPVREVRRSFVLGILTGKAFGFAGVFVLSVVLSVAAYVFATGMPEPRRAQT